MNVLVDTSVWSLALRRSDTGPVPEVPVPEVKALEGCLSGRSSVFTTGLVLQELLQGFQGPRQRRLILNTFSSLPLIVPDREDHVEAASLRNLCRRGGVQIGTIDALLAQLCIQHRLHLLTGDRDFDRVAKLSDLKLLEVR
jgi:predicted nucleic acid-binding protein